MDYIVAGKAISKVMKKLSNEDYGLGDCVLESVRVMKKAHGKGNTHLGIIILLAPLARAYSIYGKLEDAIISKKTVEIIKDCSWRDAVKYFKAIRLARPGGLPPVEKLDVMKKETLSIIKERKISLFEFMNAGRKNNTVAHEYISGYEITRKTSLPELKNLWHCTDEAILNTHMKLLATYIDSHILGKYGMSVAIKVMKMAKDSAGDKRKIERFDLFLRKNGYNPGTTADLVTAALFIKLIRDYN